MTRRKAQKSKKKQRTHGYTSPFRVQKAPPKHVGSDPDQVADPMVVEWFHEIDQGSRTPELRTVPVSAVRSNPYVFRYEEASLQAMVDELANDSPHANQLRWLVVARLPHGGFVDVDTAYPCEAVKRTGLEDVKVTIIGSFTDGDCARIGISTSYPFGDASGSQGTKLSPGGPTTGAGAEQGAGGRIVFPDGYPPREESAILEELAAELAAGEPVSSSDLARPEEDLYPALVAVLAEALRAGYELPTPVVFGEGPRAVGCGRATLYILAACVEADINLNALVFPEEPPEGDAWTKVIHELEPQMWRRMYEVVDRFAGRKVLVFGDGDRAAPVEPEPEIQGGIGGASFGKVSATADGTPPLDITVGTWWEGALVFDLDHGTDAAEAEAMYVVVDREDAHGATVARSILDALVAAKLTGDGDPKPFTLQDSLNEDRWLRLSAGEQGVDVVASDGSVQFMAALTVEDAVRLSALIEEATEALGW